MDFNDTRAEAEFRAEVRDWLGANAAPFVIDRQSIDMIEEARRGRGWQRHKAAAGYGGVCLPRAVGGREATPMQEVIFAEEEGRYALPVGVYTNIGVNLVVPTLLAHGTPEQVARFVKATIDGDLQWCQLFSEPAAGSDLAGIRARATRDGDAWVVSGQKVWNSWAHTADWGVMIARTDPAVAKHKGITYFIVDMKSPGVEVRPIKQVSGESEFNEVFLTEVRVPDSCRVGAVGAGWKVAMTTLMNERATATAESNALPDTRDLLAAARQHPDAEALTLTMARLVWQEMGLRNYRFRQLTLLSQGKQPGAEAAMGKLVLGRMLQELSAQSLELLGDAGLCPDAASGREVHKLQHGYWWGAALRIAGGADEILRNQLAERVLNLPGDLRVDKDLPFNKIPTGQ
jgi:alkylation response protein AidB-like acyl-CoA dehydrogenase